MTRVLVVLAILALTSVGAAALELAHDDGSFGGFESRNPFEADAVEFALPTADPYLLQSVRVFLSPFGPTPGSMLIDLHVWDASLTDVYNQTFDVNITGAGWYDLDVTAATIIVDDIFRVGVFWVEGTAALGLLGLDGTTPTGDSYIYASTVDTWIQNNVSNYGIRAVVEVAPPISVAVDIKPGSDPNSVSLRSRGLLPVAILGSAVLDVALVNAASLALDGVGIAPRAAGGRRSRPAYSLEDVNDDGLVDAVAFFSVSELVAAGALTETTTSLMLTGALVTGIPLQGADAVRVVPEPTASPLDERRSPR